MNSVVVKTNKFRSVKSVSSRKVLNVVSISRYNELPHFVAIIVPVYVILMFLGSSERRETS